MTITTSPTSSTPERGHFQWNITQRLLLIDHGGHFTAAGRLDALLEEGGISAGVFDPLHLIDASHRSRLATLDNVQCIDDSLLETGNSAQLRHCHDVALSGSLEPLDTHLLAAGLQQACRVEQRAPIDTMRLDDVAALPSIDWLILSGCHDHLALLNNGGNKLADTLLFDVQAAVLPTHKRQPSLTAISQWMERHHYQCYRLDNAVTVSHLSPQLVLEKQCASQTLSLNAIFIPNEQKLSAMNPQRIIQLAYLLDSAYGFHDYAYALLNRVAADSGATYLAARGFLGRYAQQPDHFVLTADYSPTPWNQAQNDALLKAAGKTCQPRHR